MAKGILDVVQSNGFSNIPILSFHFRFVTHDEASTRTQVDKVKLSGLNVSVNVVEYQDFEDWNFLILQFNGFLP